MIELNSAQMIVKVRPSTRKQLEQIAEEMKCSKAYVIRLAIDEYLKQRRPKTKKK